MERWRRHRYARDSQDRFNGATAFRRWKASIPDVIAIRASLRLQWGHRLSAMERAADSQAAPLPVRASMGPPPFGDGKGRGTARPRPRSRCFNGATAFRRWKVLERALQTATTLVLQWGHRLSAMESRRHRPAGPACREASMGPPPFGDGKAQSSRGRSYSPACFNGATAFRRWKDAYGWSWELVRDALQWGHRLSAMERI